MTDVRKIDIRDTPLTNLVRDLEDGTYRIPQFQREFVWEKKRVIDLIDSIFREFPIGSFFLWKAERKHNLLFRHIADLQIRPIKPDDDVTFVLDGQQRLTSLYVTFKGLKAFGRDYRNICLDVVERRLVDREPNYVRYISVSDLSGSRAMEVVEGLPDLTAKRVAMDFWKAWHTYPISLVVVKDKELPEVCRIFQLINQSGKRLGRFDLVAAMTFSPDFDLRERFKKDVAAPLEEIGFGAVSPEAVTQLLALLVHGQCTERHEYELTTASIKERWSDTVGSIMLAVDLLRANMGVMKYTCLPYSAQLTLLAYFFAKSGTRAPSADHMAWFQNWFWRSSFSQYYGSGGPTRMGENRELIDSLISGGKPVFGQQVTLTPSDLAEDRMTSTSSAIRNAFLCLLATLGPLHLENGSPLDLNGLNASEFTDPEKHHIFPRAFLRSKGLVGREIHALPNFCFLPAELNNRILDSDPATYFQKLRGGPRFETAARTHLLPLEPDSGIEDNDYWKFLLARAKLIFEEVERLCGYPATPRRGERARELGEIEKALRDTIDATLTVAVGPKYWKTNIPEDVRRYAEDAISAKLSHEPTLSWTNFAAPRSRLDFVDVSQYEKIIVSGGNWRYFQPRFRNKEETQQQLRALIPYRADDAHHHPEIGRLVMKKGELAVVWLKTYLTAQNTDNDNGSDPD